MILSSNITVCIFAWNEERRIVRCIENFRGRFSILVVDNCSTDNTVDVAEQAGVRAVRIHNPGFIETPEVFDKLLPLCDTEYILIASVSEYVPLVLMKLYANVANDKRYDVVRAYRVSITAGKPIPIGGRPSKADPGHLRFFRKGAVSYEANQVHGVGRTVVEKQRVLSVVTEPVHHFYQFRDYDCSRTEQVLCRYNDVLARQRHAAGTQFSLARAMWRSFLAFANGYFRFGAFRFGMLGFLHSYYRFQMEFTTWLRMWEIERGLVMAEVARRNNAERMRLEARDRE